MSLLLHRCDDVNSPVISSIGNEEDLSSTENVERQEAIVQTENGEEEAVVQTENEEPQEVMIPTENEDQQEHEELEAKDKKRKKYEAVISDGHTFHRSKTLNGGETIYLDCAG